MRQICSICGKEDDETFMFRIQTSRVQWMCDKCHNVALREIDRSEVMKRPRIFMRHKEEAKK
jgi:ribosome-binding protein aMBF1 (putative translation factor)